MTTAALQPAPGSAVFASQWRRTVALLVLGGVAMWLAYPPAGLALLTWIPPCALGAVAGILATERVERRWRLYATVWLVSALKWWALNAWLVQVTPVGMVALSFYGAAYDVLSVWLLVRADRACRSRVPWALLLPLALGASEALRSLVLFDGYPWFRAGHPLADWPVWIQCCDLGGEILATLLVGCVAGAVLDLRMGRLQHRARWVGPALAGLAAAAAFAYGAFRLGQAPQQAGPGVLAVQTNLSTSNKLAWTPDQQMVDVSSFAALTVQGAIQATREGQSFAIAAWPETMMGGYGLELETLAMMDRDGYFPGSRFQRMASRISENLGVPLIVGSPVFLNMRVGTEGHWAWDHQYNSAYLVTTSAPPYARYDKLFLAPFGETMPYIRAVPGLQNALLSIGAQGMRFDLEAGAAPVRFRLPWRTPDGQVGTVRVVTPICFEDAMSWVCRDLVYEQTPSGRVRAADLMVNLSNDGWFGWFDGGRAQHVQIACFRCVETRTPMVRVANTGMCAGIDSSGRVVNAPPASRTATWLVADPPLDTRTPLFALIGDAVSWAVMAAGAALALLSFARPVQPGTVRGAARAVALVGLACAAAAGGCDNAPKDTTDQPWSSRDQSVQPTGAPGLKERGDANSPGLRVESSGNARTTAVTLLRQAAVSDVPVFRANAAEALIASPDDLHHVARKLMADPNRGVRFVVTMAVGKAHLNDLAPAVEALLVDESLSVRAAAIYALAKMGRTVDPSPLAAMVMSDDPEIRGNAFMVLGELNNRTAVPLIKSAVNKPMPKANPARVRICELQAAEALAKLGQLQSLDAIRAALFDPTATSEIIPLAAQIAGRLHDEGSRPVLVRMITGTGATARPPEVKLLAAVSLAELSPQDNAAIQKLAEGYIGDRMAEVRAQAALALAWSMGPAAVATLERMLFDPEPSVQLTAAKAILVATRAR